MKSTVEHLQQLEEKHSGLVVILTDNFFHKLFQPGEQVIDKLLQRLFRFEGQPFIEPSNLPAEVRSCRNGSIKILFEKPIESICVLLVVY